MLFPILLGAALRVDGKVTCPEPKQVSADLQKILEISTEYAPQLHADLRRDGAWLELTLTGADGTSLGERRIDANEECAVLSHTVAVVLATWLSDEHPEYVVALPTVDAAQATVPTPTNEAPRTPAPPANPQAPSPPTVAVLPVQARGRALSAAGAREAHHLALSAALGGALGSSEFAPSASLGLSLDPGIQGLGVDLAAAWVAARSEPLAAHSVSWSRWPVFLGPYLRLVTRVGRFDLGAGGTLAWLRLEGRDFSPNVATSHAAFGSYAALRFLPRAGAWQPFVLVMPALWFGRATAFASGTNGAAADATLPSIDLLFAAGMRFLP